MKNIPTITTDGDDLVPEIEEGHAIKEKPRLSKQAQAVAYLLDHPDWTIEQIARELGVARTTPYDWPLFQDALAARKQAKLERGRGHKYKGHVEAHDEAGADLAEQNSHRRPQHRSNWDSDDDD